MHTPLPNLNADASGYHITIIAAVFHENLVEQYIKNTIDELIKRGATKEKIKVVRVGGALEIPYICKRIINFRTTDIIIALGLVIRGETTHYDLVTQNTFTGLMNLQIGTGNTPIGFGILACENEQQAQERISITGQNKAGQVVQAVLNQENITRNIL